MSRTNFTLYLLIFLCSCSASNYSHKWSAWGKDPDNPGLHYRVLCQGPTFSGSSFYRWEVEIFNDYSEDVSLEVALGGANTEAELSEKKTAIIATSNMRKLIFLNAKLPCSQIFQVKFENVQLLP